MRIMRMIGLATLGYSAYKAYQSYSRSGSLGGSDLTGSSGMGRFRNLRRGGAL